LARLTVIPFWDKQSALSQPPVATKSSDVAFHGAASTMALLL
jgi:hypothetical protein